MKLAAFLLAWAIALHSASAQNVFLKDLKQITDDAKAAGQRFKEGYQASSNGVVNKSIEGLIQTATPEADEQTRKVQRAGVKYLLDPNSQRKEQHFETMMNEVRNAASGAPQNSTPARLGTPTGSLSPVPSNSEAGNLQTGPARQAPLPPLGNPTALRPAAASVDTSQGVKGAIQVTCEPGALVFLDGIFKGTATKDFGGWIVQEVPAGQHVLKVVKEGFQPQEFRVNLESGQIREVKLNPFRSQIEISQSGGKKDEKEMLGKVGHLLIQTLPVGCIIDIPALGISNFEKLEDKWHAQKIAVGNYTASFRALGKTFSYELPVNENQTTHFLVNFVDGKVRDLGAEGKTLAEAEAKRQAQAQMQAEAAARAKAEVAAKARALDEARRQAEAQEKAEAEARSKSEAQQRAKKAAEERRARERKVEFTMGFNSQREFVLGGNTYILSTHNFQPQRFYAALRRKTGNVVGFLLKDWIEFELGTKNDRVKGGRLTIDGRELSYSFVKLDNEYSVTWERED